MKRFLALGLVLTGCAAYDLSATGQFRPSPNGFEFITIADTAYPLASADAEAKRIARLVQYLADTGTCPEGYRLTNRQAVQRFKGVHDVIYTGRCD